MSERLPDTLAELARQRQAGFDEQLAVWREGHGQGVRLWCGPGCGNCCTLTVNATLPEALAIAGMLDDGQRQRLAATAARLIAHARTCGDARAFLAGYRSAVGPCPFLEAAGNCTIYPLRPLACRALLSTRPPDWCGVNLAELPAFERDAFLASLDRSLVAFPSHYAAAPGELAAECERDLLLAMLRTVGFGVTGSLPLLVWLAGQADFAAALAGGADTFRNLLENHQCLHPCLVQLHLP